MNNKKSIITAGLVVGALSSLLVVFGNAANMGICVACFIRDIAGGLGMHQAEIVQYLRPEIAGFILGAFLIALFTGEFKPRGGSSPITRFIMGIFMMIGALVFLGCPLRMILRLAGGDLNAIAGIFGFATGIIIGAQFIKRGFTLGRAHEQEEINGYIMPFIAVVLLILLVAAPSFILFSSEGPGSMVAPIALALIAGLVVGILAQKSRLCMAGGIRDLYLIKDSHLIIGFLMIFLAALGLNLVTGNFTLGFVDQPVAHTDGLWNFLGMGLVGLASVLLGGCPLRQTILAGEGNTDAAITFMGMLVGAAISHNFGLAGSPEGVEFAGRAAVIIGIVVVLLIGFNQIYDFGIIKKGGVKHGA